MMSTGDARSNSEPTSARDYPPTSGGTAQQSPPLSAHGSGASPLTQAQRIAFVRSHYESKGYRVHSGLQFGCELVLYADDPSQVHSDFCVHVVSGPDGRADWRMVQTLVRSMPDLHKTLILAHVREKRGRNGGRDGDGAERIGGNEDGGEGGAEYEVAELAIATEHAPFRHKAAARRSVEVGSQVKKRKASPRGDGGARGSS